MSWLLLPSRLLVRILARAYAAQCCAYAPDFEDGPFEDHRSMALPYVLLRSYCHWQEQEEAQPGYTLEPSFGSTLVAWATAIPRVFLIMFILSTYYIHLKIFSANGRNLADFLLQKPLKIWNRDRFECKSKRHHHNLWPLWQNTDGSMPRNFQKFINLELSTHLNTLMFVWMERTLLCEGQMNSHENSFYFFNIFNVF